MKRSHTTHDIDWTPRIRSRRRRREGMRLGGFLYGCALGGAAAAMILLVMRTVL